MNTTLVRVTTVAAVVVVALIAAVVSYSHMQQLADRAGEAWRSYLIPLSIDGLVVAASMVLLTRRRNGLPGGRLAWSALAGGVLASLAANMADARPQVTAVLVAGWPALAFAVAFELLLQQRRADRSDALVPPDVPLSDPPTTPAPATPTPTPLIAPALRPEPVVTTPAMATPPLSASKPPVRVSSTGVAPAPEPEPLQTRLRGLVERTGRIPGRRAVAAELGISEHAARLLIEKHASRNGALK